MLLALGRGEVMEKLFMGVDTGTQGIRISIATPDGRLKVSCEEKWDTQYPKKGWVEQLPKNWWENISKAIRKCVLSLTEEERMNIVSCCVCATSSTVFAVREDGEPLMPAIMWMDARAKKEAEAINQTGHEVLKYCGGSVSFEWLVPKTLWIKNNEPEIYDSCYRIVEQLDWINYMLCGQWVGSICNAACKWNYVKAKGGFVRDYFETIGLPEYEEKILTDIRKVGEKIGTIRPELAKEFGINPDMQVIQGGIDAHVAMFGMNVIGKRQMGIIMGTSFVHLSLVDEEPSSIQGIWGPYDSAVVDDKWLLEGGQTTASGLVNWFRNNFHIDGIDGNPYQQLMQAATEISPGAEGITILDFFQGNRTPYKDADAKGVIFGLNVKHTWKHIYRALIESISFGTRNILENQINQGYDVDTIVACGGVTQDRVWMQIMADITGKELVVNENLQAGTMGCCVLAATGGGYYNTFEEAANAMVKVKTSYKPNMERHALYDKPFENYKKLYANLKDMMKD